MNSVLTELDRPNFDAYAKLALKGVVRQYPNQPGYRLASDADVAPPRVIHPAFFGCYDWHSAVHGHWLLARLLRAGVLSTPVASEAASHLRAHLTPERLAIELDYFRRPGCAGFEWPYGWAWLLALHAEAKRWDSGVADSLAPLAAELAGRVPGKLSAMRAPQRTGQHGDTAFALQLMLEAGVDASLADTIHKSARRWYGNDRDYPWRYEQGPYDFHSPGLSVIGLMRFVLTPDALADWLRGFWPGLFASPPAWGPLSEPAVCHDNTDGKLAHLYGLNLERARGLLMLRDAWPDDPKLPDGLSALALHHAEAGLVGVHSGEYAGEHWLATFAVRLLRPANDRV